MILDAAGRPDVKIFASSDLDEWKIRDLLAAGAPIDAFGVGTELITSHDAPALSMVYKLVELSGRGRVKLAPGKRTYPQSKQVWRNLDSDGRFSGDHVTRADETAAGLPMLQPVLRAGALVSGLPSLAECRAWAEDQQRSRVRHPECWRTLPATLSRIVPAWKTTPGRPGSGLEDDGRFATRDGDGKTFHGAPHGFTAVGRGTWPVSMSSMSRSRRFSIASSRRSSDVASTPSFGCESLGSRYTTRRSPCRS